MGKKNATLTANSSLAQSGRVTSPKRVRKAVIQNPQGDTIMDIKEFTIHVENFASNKLDFKFKNPGKQHAAVVLCAMARHAEKSFIVYDENLEGDLTTGTEFYSELENFLSKGGTFSIITKDNPSENDSKKILQGLKEKFNNSVQISYIKPEALRSQEFDRSLISNCFTVVDEIGYRLEYDFTNRQAYFNFNDPQECKELSSRFEKIKPFTAPAL